jgi:hypothetical protein
VDGFLARLLATRSGIITSASSSQLCQLTFNLKQNAPLPDVFRRIQSFGGELESRTLSAQDPLTSELLRTL